MRIADVHIENYRALKECHFALGPLACIIGENNTGKSSLLLGMRLFYSGTALGATDFYDPSRPVRIAVRLTAVTQKDLEHIPDLEHRSRIAGLVRNDEMRLVMQWELDGKSTLLCESKVPKDARYSDASISSAILGKKGKAIAQALQGLFPEHADKFTDVTTQTAGRAAIAEITETLTEDQLVPEEKALPSGIPASVRRFLPEPILIPAVKDVRDELKTSEAATFGKLVSFLLNIIEEADELKSISSALAGLHQLLNVVTNVDGTTSDSRLEQVKTIEASLMKNLRESFPAISLELQVPKPELRQIFSTAQIVIDDGIKSDVQSKGDGLKRAVIFALLRTYVALSRAADSSAGNSGAPAYVILFEEPELYLHPSAQRVLFEALRRLSSSHQVVLSTHSPVFLGPATTRTFIKLTKRVPTESGARPFSEALAIDLDSDLTVRDAFQLICYENSAAGFFAAKIILVEGDSDTIFFRHAGGVLCPDWHDRARAVEFVRLNGKTNLKRFREFFSRFGVRTYAILDLDFLIEGIDAIDLPDPIPSLRADLLAEIDGMAAARAAGTSLSGDVVRQLVRKRTWAERYTRLKQIAEAMTKGQAPTSDELLEIGLLFEGEAVHRRLQVLHENHSALKCAEPLLRALWAHDVFVLSAGSVESYYPPGTRGQDKPSRAIDACAKLTCQADFAKYCPVVTDGEDAKLELEHYLTRILSVVPVAA